VVVAAPVASDEAAALIGAECDAIVILGIPPSLRAVGEWYLDFGQVEDREVCELLQDSGRGRKHLGRSRATAR
jgi:putative phosphoribosyl transferase